MCCRTSLLWILCGKCEGCGGHGMDGGLVVGHWETYEHGHGSRGDHWAKIVEKRAIKNRVQYIHCR